MFEKTHIQDLVVYNPKVFADERGYLTVGYNQKPFAENGMSYEFVQDTVSVSKKGTLRGLHFQTGDAAQAKLVTVVHGEAYDVAVDLRKGSETYGKWYGIHLTSEKPQYMMIPRGFAHGFLALTDYVVFTYKVDNHYSPQSEAGIIYNDPTLDIEWPMDSSQLIVSEKDQKLLSFKDYSNL